MTSRTKTNKVEAKEDFLREYQDVLDQETILKLMKTTPMKIKLKENAKPFAIHVARAARRILYAMREKTKAELDKLVEDKIIEPVGDEPCDWVHPMVVVPTRKDNAVL